MSELNVLRPARLGRLTLRNRIICPPMVTRFADENGNVTDRLIAYAAERARGGAGLFTLEASFVSPEGKGFTHGVGIESDDRIPGLRTLTDAVHAAGGLISVQLHHAGRETSSRTTSLPLVAPSDCPVSYSCETVHELTEQEIRHIIQKFAEAATRAVKSGFDAVEIHGAHGYLLSQFLSPYTNKRMDSWGGSMERRRAFPLAVARAVREAAGNDFTVTFRLTVDEAFPGGLTLQEGTAAAAALASSGYIDALHIVAGNYASPEAIIPPATEGYVTNRARAVAVREAVGDFPLIVAGRIKNVFMAEELIQNGIADFVAMGRALIADPYLPILCSKGHFSSVRTCLGCNDGCAGQTEQELPTACSINPRMGFEGEFPLTVRTQEQRKKILVAGAGPAGMEAAWTAARIGHEVLLYEKNNHVGGQFMLASVPPGKDEIFVYLHNMVQRLKDAGVHLHLNTTVTPELIREARADHVIIATGGQPLVIPFKGLNDVSWMTSSDVLTWGLNRLGSKVAVIGGGLVGCECAEYVAGSNRHVTIIEMQNDCASGLQHSVRKKLMEQLASRHVRLVTGARVEALASDGITLCSSGENTKLGPFDSIVFAMGSRADTLLLRKLEKSNIPYSVIGDALKTGKVLAATASALRAAAKL